MEDLDNVVGIATFTGIMFVPCEQKALPAGFLFPCHEPDADFPGLDGTPGRLFAHLCGPKEKTDLLGVPLCQDGQEVYDLVGSAACRGTSPSDLTVGSCELSTARCCGLGSSGYLLHTEFDGVAVQALRALC